MWKTSPGWMRTIIVATDVMVILGTAISPQIAKPFLQRQLRESNVTSNTTTSTMTDDEVLHPVQIAYFIMGALDVVMVIICMSMCAWSTIRGGRRVGLCLRDSDNDDDIQLIPDGNEDRSNAVEDKVKPCSRLGCVQLTLAMLLLVTYGGVFDVLFIYLLYTYLNEYLGWSVASSTLLASVCPVTSVVFGGVVAVVSYWVSPTQLTIFNLVMWFVSSILMFTAQTAGIDAFTVVGAVISSATASNMYPTTVALIEETMDVIAPVMALIISSMGMSSILWGPVAGTLLHTFGALAFPSMQLGLTLTAVTLFVAYSVLTRVTTQVKPNGV